MPKKMDGRRARGLRTRDAIINALLELVGEGDVSPTAQRIAEQADVSVRSVYQHFNDVAGLFTATSERARRTADEMTVSIDPGLPLKDRLERFVTARSALLEALMPFIRAARLIEPTSDVLRQHRASLEKRARDELGKVFGPELAATQGAARRQMISTLDVLSTWSAWEHLRDNNTGVRTARLVMHNGLHALLLGLPSVTG